MYYIYLLSDNGVPFYIGVTQNLKNRLSEHKTTYGPTIVIEKIDEHEGSLTTAMALEQLWIRKYQDKGIVLKNKEPKNIGVSETICVHCGAVTMQYSGKREKKFCSTSCRVMYNRKHGKKKEVTPLQMQVLYNSMLELVGKMGTGPLQVERIPPLSKKEETAMFNYEHKDQLTILSDAPTFQDLMNGIEGVLFADEKEEYAHKIKAATHLSDKQRNLLLANLRQSK